MTGGLLLWQRTKACRL